MRTLRGQTKIEVEQPEGIVIIQAPSREFQVQSNGSVLPTTLLLTSFIQYIEFPIYYWSYYNGTTWVAITSGSNKPTYTVEWGTWDKRQFKLEVLGYTTSARTTRSTQMGVSIIEINKLPYSASYAETADQLAALRDNLSWDEGGMVSKVIMLLREAGKEDVTAGISGIQGDGEKPAVWGGGSHTEALRFAELLSALKNNTTFPVEKIANFIINHDGSGKFGKLIADEQGQVMVVNPTTRQPSLIINDYVLPDFDSILDLTPDSKERTNYTKTINNNELFTLTNKITIPKDGGRLTVTGTATLSSTMGDRSSVTGQVRLFRGGAFYSNLYLNTKSARLLPPSPPSITYENVGIINASLEYVPQGEYEIRMEVSNAFAPLSKLILSATTMTWAFDGAPPNRVQIGSNGFMAWFGDEYMYFTAETGLKTTPSKSGYVGGFNVSPTGVISNATGPFTFISEKGGAGSYDFKHNMLTADYKIVITPKIQSMEFYVATNAYYFTVRTSTGGTYTNRGFDVLVFK